MHDEISESVEKTCRICFGTDPTMEGFVRPCKCLYMPYVHQECLLRWRREGKKEACYTHCDVCNYKYKVQRRKVKYTVEGPPLFEDSCRRLAFLLVVVLLATGVSLAAFFFIYNVVLKPATTMESRDSGFPYQKHRPYRNAQNNNNNGVNGNTAATAANRIVTSDSSKNKPLDTRTDRDREREREQPDGKKQQIGGKLDGTRQDSHPIELLAVSVEGLCLSAAAIALVIAYTLVLMLCGFVGKVIFYIYHVVLCFVCASAAAFPETMSTTMKLCAAALPRALKNRIFVSSLLERLGLTVDPINADTTLSSYNDYSELLRSAVRSLTGINFSKLFDSAATTSGSELGASTETATSTACGQCLEAAFQLWTTVDYHHFLIGAVIMGMTIGVGVGIALGSRLAALSASTDAYAPTFNFSRYKELVEDYPMPSAVASSKLAVSLEGDDSLNAKSPP